MTRPRLLDLFCGAGGATRGYQQAGFYVVGVDIEPQPHYIGDEFVQADALEFLRQASRLADVGGPYTLTEFDAIHASPVCKTFARVTAWRGSRGNHPDTLRPVLAWLRTCSLPWVVENVPEAPLRPDIILCGSQFGLNVRRHRVFETSWRAYDLIPECRHHGLLPFMHKAERAYADAMGCTWMTKEEARQAIPPAYTEYIGGLLLAALEAAA
jgi:SAM-dependent methyltransferase